MTEDHGDIHLTVTLREWTRLVIAVEKQRAYYLQQSEKGNGLMNMWHWEQGQACEALAKKLSKQQAEGDS